MSKKKIIIAALALAAIVGVTMCVRAAMNAPTAGEVIAKDYHRPYTSTTIVNKVPVINHHPARWTLTIEGTQADGETGTWTYDVDERTHARAKIGDWYDSETGMLDELEKDFE